MHTTTALQWFSLNAIPAPLAFGWGLWQSKVVSPPQGLACALPMRSVRRAPSISAVFVLRSSDSVPIRPAWTQPRSAWMIRPRPLHKRRLNSGTLRTSPLKRPPSQKNKFRNKYKEHWSPTYAAFQAQLLGMTRIQPYLGVLPLPRRLSPWFTPQAIRQGIADTVHGWECAVASLTFHGGIPPEVYSTGLTP